MTSDVERLSPSARRVRDAKKRVEAMRKHADSLRNKPDLHRQAVRTLNLLEDSLFEISQAHELLERLSAARPVTLP